MGTRRRRHRRRQRSRARWLVPPDSCKPAAAISNGAHVHAWIERLEPTFRQMTRTEIGTTRSLGVCHWMPPYPFGDRPAVFLPLTAIDRGFEAFTVGSSLRGDCRDSVTPRLARSIGPRGGSARSHLALRMSAMGRSDRCKAFPCRGSAQVRPCTGCHALRPTSLGFYHLVRRAMIEPRLSATFQSHGPSRNWTAVL